MRNNYRMTEPNCTTHVSTVSWLGWGTRQELGESFGEERGNLLEDNQDRSAHWFNLIG